MKSKYRQLIVELIIWSAFVVFPLILFPTLQPFFSQGRINPPLKGLLITHGLLIVFYYINFYYAIPKYYHKKKFTTYLALVAGYLLAVILILLTDRSFNPLPSPPFRFPVTAFIFTIIIRFIMVTLLSLGISSIQRLQTSEREKLRSELSYLKAQVNPHFLFNTLNSIYALTVKKSDAAPESVTKLSSIMRYVITEATGDFVSLDKEIDYVSAYVDLEKLRLTQKVKLGFHLRGEFSGKKIAPMLLIPLVENVFKHGVSTSEDSEIEITISLKNNLLQLTTRNTKVRAEKINSTGLGIDNVKKRLELLYPGKYTLTVEDLGKDFKVKLELKLGD